MVRIAHKPTFVSVEPAAVCQLRCPECPVGQEKVRGTKDATSRLMPREIWQRVLTQIAPFGHTIQFYFQGEPLLHQDLPQMIREAHEAGLYTIVSTNGQAMTPLMAEDLIRAGLNRIIVSMDGLTQETYGAYRVGGSLETTKKALTYLRAAKERLHGRTTIELQCLRLKTNEDEWSAFKEQYKSLGADKLVFKTAQLYNYRDGHPLMPTQECYRRYTKGPDGHFHRKHLRRGCLRVWSGCVITTSGEVLPCCYDKGRDYAYGNIMKTPIKELFSNPQALAFRRAALNGRPNICQECWK